MPETIRYRLAGLEDIATGNGTFTAKLADGRVTTLTKVRVPLVSSNGAVTLTNAATTYTATFATINTADYQIMPEFSYWVNWKATAKSATGFTIALSDPVPSASETIRWAVL